MDGIWTGFSFFSTQKTITQTEKTVYLPQQKNTKKQLSQNHREKNIVSGYYRITGFASPFRTDSPVIYGEGRIKPVCKTTSRGHS